MRRHVYEFGKDEGWKEVGLQILIASGWRPDCAKADAAYLGRVLPPSLKKGAPLLIGPPSGNYWIAREEIQGYEDRPPTMHNTILIEVTQRMTGGAMYTISYMCKPNGEVRTQCRFHGTRPWKGYPEYLKEVVMVHALELALDCVAKGEATENGVQYVEIRAGNLTLCDLLFAWFAKGGWHLQSAAAQKIACLCNEVAQLLPVPLKVYSSEPEGPMEETVREHLDIGWAVN